MNRQQIRDAARLIARELPATIDGRAGNSDAHKRMYELYEFGKWHKSFSEAAEDARAVWIEEVLIELSRNP
jgi:hypothetical protein